MSYESEDEKLNVTVHEAEGLPGGDLPDPPDPHAKLYLFPERSFKRRSNVKKDTVNPNDAETLQVVYLNAVE